MQIINMCQYECKHYGNLETCLRGSVMGVTAFCHFMHRLLCSRRMVLIIPVTNVRKNGAKRK